MEEEVLAKLLPFQKPHLNKLFNAYLSKNCIGDFSDTGCGKSYIAIALAKLAHVKPFIVCPKSVITVWEGVCKLFGCEFYGISNYELLKNCKHFVADLEKTNCPYVDKIKTVIKTRKGTKTIIDFVFQFPEDCLIILDEAHRCKNYKSMTSRLLLSIHDTGRKLLLLSATLADKLVCFKPFGVVFGFYNKQNEFKVWMRRQLKEEAKNNLEEYLKDKNDCEMYIIHKHLFPNFGARMRIKELGNQFPENQIVASCYYLKNYEKINELYEIINEAMEHLKDAETRASGLAELIYARQRIELLKIPIFLDLIREGIENDFSVVVFVNYVETLERLMSELNVKCVIRGEQSQEERQENIQNFQDNKEHIILAMIQAGSVGISLHDLHGRKRMAIISPTWNCTDLKQSLGRIHRAGAKSKAVQKIVYCAKTYEEQVCEIMNRKLTTLATLNDGDLAGPNYPQENIEMINDIDERINRYRKK